MQFPGKWIIIVLLGLIFAFLGCSRKTLQFFFDGVPEEQKTFDNRYPVPVIASDTSGSVTGKPLNSGNASSSHPPFTLKKCDLCHDPARKGKQIMSQPFLCNTCHADYRVYYKFRHGPADGGLCTTCHNPHESSNPKLLTKKANDLCLYCHNGQTFLSGDIHRGKEQRSCIECHDPHGSNKKYFLR